MFDKKQLQHAFFIALISALSILSFFVLRPYIFTLLLALILAVAMDPVFLKIRSWMKGRKKMAAAATLVLMLFIIIIPLLFFSYLIFLEAQNAYTAIAQRGGDASPFLDRLAQSNETLRFIKDYVSQEIGSIAKTTLNFFLTRVGSVFSSIFGLILNAMLFFFAFFNVLSHREELYGLVSKISPLENTYDIMIIRKIKAACSSVVRGNLAVALIQGVVASVGFTLFGVPAPMIWGGIAAFAALVPTLGTTLITAPMIAYLFLSGHTASAIGLLIWAIFAVGLIDNILAPILIDRGIHLHPFLILLAVLGGVSFFGPVGFVLGPVVLAFLMGLIEAYAAFNKSGKTREKRTAPSA